MLLENIEIVLSRTLHPGNIGSAARAIKNMGLSKLVLLNPCEFTVDRGMAKAMAAGAENILSEARICRTTEDAVGKSVLLFGTSARSRGVQWPLLTAREAAEKIIQESQAGVTPISILFGCENSGLTNDELNTCQYHVHIPANPDYSSLNLAAAVQVMTYELRVAWLNFQEKPIKVEAEVLASVQEMEGYFKHLEEVLHQIKFIHPRQPKKIMQRLRRIYAKARPDSIEINILRGILTETQRMLGLKEKS